MTVSDISRHFRNSIFGFSNWLNMEDIWSVTKFTSKKSNFLFSQISMFKSWTSRQLDRRFLIESLHEIVTNNLNVEFRNGKVNFGEESLFFQIELLEVTLGKVSAHKSKINYTLSINTGRQQCALRLEKYYCWIHLRNQLRGSGVPAQCFCSMFLLKCAGVFSVNLANILMNYLVV